MTGSFGTFVGMRPDRLVASLVLQRREQATTEELDASERTARRDIDALAMSGIPVYSIQGRGGGRRLLGGARTDLSGLTASETRARPAGALPSTSARPTESTCSESKSATTSEQETPPPTDAPLS